MSLLHFQNWDAGTIIPAGWNVDSSLGIASAGAISPPNVLQLASGATSGSYFYGTYGTADGNSGNVRVSTYLTYQAHGGNENRIGLTARGSAATLNSSSTSYYGLWTCDPITVGKTNEFVRIVKMVSGAETNLKTLNLGSDQFDLGTWYWLLFVLEGTTLKGALQRQTDLLWLSPSTGNFTAGFNWAVQVTDGSLSGSGYNGLMYTQGQASQFPLTDNWQLESIDKVTWPDVRRTDIPRNHDPRYWV